MVFDTATQIGFKFSAMEAAPADFDLGWLERLIVEKWIYVAILGYLGAFVTWMTLLRHAPVGPAFAASHLEIVSVLFFSVIFLGETLTGGQVLGSLLIVCGIGLLTPRSEGNPPQKAEPKRWRELPPTAGLPLRWRDFLPTGGGLDFETALARFLNVPAVQVECSGTACLVIALETLKRVSARRTVVIPAYTCPLVPMAVARAGLRVRLCDTRKDRFDFDPDALSAACDSDTLCIVPTHLGGLVADLAPVLEIARRIGATVVEDAAQSLGATWKGRPVGTIGDIGFYSLARGKGLTLYEGGVLTARDEAMRRALMKTRDELVRPRPILELIRLGQLFGYRLGYHPAALRLTYGLPLRYWLKRSDPVRAVGDAFGTDIPLHRIGLWRKKIGASAFKRLPSVLMENAERGRRRAKQLDGIRGLRVVNDLPRTHGTWPFLMVLFETEAACEQALSRLWCSGLGVTRLYVSDLSGYADLRDIVPGPPGPNARSFSHRCLTISNSAWVSDAEFSEICEALADHLANPPKGSISTSGSGLDGGFDVDPGREGEAKAGRPIGSELFSKTAGRGETRSHP
jgi:perosamine synthetase